MTNLIDRQWRAAVLLGLSSIVVLVAWVVIELREPVFGGGVMLIPASAIGGAIAGILTCGFFGRTGYTGWMISFVAFFVASLLIGAIVGVLIFVSSPVMGAKIGAGTVLQIVLAWKITPIWLACWVGVQWKMIGFAK